MAADALWGRCSMIDSWCIVGQVGWIVQYLQLTWLYDRGLLNCKLLTLFSTPNSTVFPLDCSAYTVMALLVWVVCFPYSSCVGGNES